MMSREKPSVPEKDWDFKSVTQNEVLTLLKYLLYLVEFLPPAQRKTFNESSVRSDAEYLIDALELDTEI
ncbi:MAG: hypothetical protein LBG90_02295 [Spirochaetaceae bacterium]|jgi:hypothetical protein|nr:hypothetical protein [Spirochaetaceae bacterium]